MKDLGGITAADLRRAVSIYLDCAYRDAATPPNLPWPPARSIRDEPGAVHEEKGFHDDDDLTRLLTLFEDESSRFDGAVRRWVMRLGNRRYPFMKIVIQEHLLAGKFFFSVDTHDQFDISPDFPDYAAWLDLRGANRLVCREIEQRWEMAGLPTSAMLLREIERSIHRVEPTDTSGSGVERGPLRGDVLIVDDDRNLCRCVALILGSAGFRVTEAADGAEGLKRIAENEYDLVIADYEMPGVDGLELIEAIRSLEGSRAQTPVLLTSAASIAAQRRAKATRFLSKPFRQESLLRAVEEIIESSA